MKLPSRNFKKMLLSVSQDGYKDGLQKKMLPTTSKLKLLLMVSKTLSKLSTKLPALMSPKFSEIELLLIEPMVKSFQALMMKNLPSQPLPSLPVNSMPELFKNPTMLSTPQLSHQLMILKKKKLKRMRIKKNQKLQPVEIEPSIDQCQG